LKVLVLGAGGFIGRHTVAGLRAAGHEVVPSAIRFERALRPQAWLHALGGVEAVVNAVGILRERGGQTFRTLHDAAPRALFQACETAGVRRVVQISALGADEGARSRFHLSKKRADDFLASSALDWAIVQPSLVFGEGGRSTRLFTLLAALPVTPLPGDGRQRVQPIHIDDLTEVIVKLVAWPVKTKVHAVGPREVTLRDWLALLRAQMGLGKARFIEMPRAMVPLERETLQMLERGNTASPATVTQLLRRAPCAPERFIGSGQGRALATRARLDWLLPLLRASVAMVWIASGVTSLGLYPLEDSLALLLRVGLSGPPAMAVLQGAAALDIAMGLGSLLLRKRRWLWRSQILLILGYSAIVALWLPEFLLHPFAPVLKNLPMLAAIVALHELEERG
jgi:uncharacterized protein YbjT (DUF2867 family)